MFEFPDIHPVAFSIGPVVVRWYALAYLAGMVLGLIVATRLVRQQRVGVTRRHLDDLLLWIILGVVVGGRLGYVLFYKPAYYLAHPIEIFMTWEGGMSYHGGMLGVALAIILYGRKHKQPLFAISDVIAIVTPIGLFFGRIANFINAELWGRVTEHPFGIVFPNGGPLPRHPSQLYEAFGEGLLLFALLMGLWQIKRLRGRAGLFTGVFLMGYGITRALVELVREPDAHLGTVLGPLTMGQLLSFPMILAGLGFIIYAMTRPPLPEQPDEPDQPGDDDKADEVSA